VTEGRPAIVEAHEEGAFRAALDARGGQVKPIGLIAGLDYSTNRHDILRLYRPLAPAASPGSP
jgi:hypothetical protein